MNKAIDTSCPLARHPFTMSFDHFGNHLGFPVAVFDQDLHLRYINEAGLGGFGLTPAHADQHVSCLPLPRGLDGAVALFEMLLASGGAEALSLLIDGRPCHAELTSLRGPDGITQGLMLVVFDNLRVAPLHGVGGRTADEEAASSLAHHQRIAFLATHDNLTGLPNRSLLADRLKQAISQAKRTKQKVAVLFIDLDDFKNVNDSLGHAIGDRILKQAAARLLRCVRDADTLARLGGDEFVAVLGNVDLPDVIRVANRIVSAMSSAFSINSSKLTLSASVGIAVFPEDGNDSASLLGVADSAMYLAKQYGRNQYQFFASEMKQQALQRNQLEVDLRHAVVAGQLRMVYQPKVDMVSGRIVGAEALLRWCDPVLGDIPPSCFIPIAEHCGLMGEIGSLVFGQVLTQIALWRGRGIVVPRIAINVSSYQLRDVDFVDKIAGMITQARVPAESIGIELTESALMDRLDQALEHVLQLEKIGVTLSIDDFGIGYSSLAVLHKLPIRELKVDRSFIEGITDQPELRSIARTVIGMGHALGVRVVAEGVETTAQRQLLSEDGCDSAQGFLFYPPLEAEDFVSALAGSAIESRAHRNASIS
ncbi:EAL domain-containing protein [Actimicrobium sp. CCC2.4]|uniref:putative bifunctional diguanylate cyclase/phosphodiesterase n=1 Tax=Actimicrobium sp. CCC2.4 TaxID=3048606 RepID=UPI002AC91982|nr:EAL domain-containing protein [Actimicrobium sp. CCC2.4]MEB0136476.1 EAL domain-containing protein [Actimicrobium sp. CCC2.4]WPX30836.1 EAL domain-containing protein [Actimicrobium sp. CCC2.4]